MKPKRVRVWYPSCKRHAMVELAAGELFVKRPCPHCGKVELMGLGAEA